MENIGVNYREKGETATSETIIPVKAARAASRRAAGFAEENYNQGKERFL
ncbi:hypothetical protein MUP29_09750 [bacterium]|nr:hypothetical protein [bacterium]